MTLELARAETFAAMLAHSRASRTIEVTDLLAGMYICNWDRLSQYWQEEDREEVETWLRGICRISPQRWHFWMEYYDRERGEVKQPRILSLLRKRRKEIVSEKPLRWSAGLAAVVKQAEEIAPFRDRMEGRAIPILTSECVLLCIARSYGSEVSQKLAQMGLDATKLEQSALFPRRGPLT
ncbi:MAG TPA: hypothetical protein VN822_07480 [Candidatus Acidoferrales bacterium]|nr:hypothetical protein [Candidatus Acidoferrales bacterium]